MNPVKFLKQIITLFLIVIFSYSPASVANVISDSAGIKYFSFDDSSRNKKLSVQVWYPISKQTPSAPAKGIWKHANLALDAPIDLQVATEKNGKLPLIVLSHGYKGSPDSLSWLAITLVKQGFIVIAAQHNDAGADSKPFMEHWQRALDISFVLKKFQQTEFAKNADFNRVGMAGFSLGTATGLWLAGGIASTYERNINPGRQFVPEDEFPDVDSEVADYLMKHTDFKAAKKSYREPLIKSVFLIAPGYGWAFGAKQLSTVKIPIFLVAAEDDEMLYPQTNAYYFSKYLPNSAMKIIPDVGHFVFINETKDISEKNLSKDDMDHIKTISQLGKLRYTTKERNDVQQIVGDMAGNFFLTTLK